MQEQYVKGITFNNMSIMLPWFSNLIDEDRALLGDDWWPMASSATARPSMWSYAIIMSRD